MHNLYAPWRSIYAQSIDASKDNDTDSDACIFCGLRHDNNDATNFIVKRYTYCYVILNKYPYNAGHILILPYAHHKELNQLEYAARTEIMEVITKATTILQETLKAQGINIGLNSGKAAGAGIPSHLHFHVLPRWIGDTNFLPTLAYTKVISFDLHEIYEILKLHFK